MTRDEEIEKAAEKYADRINYSLANADSRARAFKAGAKWERKRAKILVETLYARVQELERMNQNQRAYFDENVRLKEKIQSLEARLAECKLEVSTAVKFMNDSGFENLLPEEPEFQMYKSLSILLEKLQEPAPIQRFGESKKGE